MSMLMRMTCSSRRIKSDLLSRLEMKPILSIQMILWKRFIIINFLINTWTHIGSNTVKRSISLLKICLICINLMWRTWIMSLSAFNNMWWWIVMKKLLLIKVTFCIMTGICIINCLITYQSAFFNVFNQFFFNLF